ncbi:MAG: thymidine kinase [Sphingobacteriales bacterium]|jgi:thymidine kinase|nr:thymidine kinase [Sphingobacteriales bacterium]MBP9141085.1 thymidine kinase [Chitinophagales bacterium]MDA0198307.1 thymidine kinase [Bacteroidota bacterium]MBK7526002.1 thymidine kinase [Sphingobacteriales bacterium]MBK8677712.1 thymidine kinase [Sphingobacteriales bacterium]
MSVEYRQSGWIEVVCGSMFSGKTEELIRRIKRAQIANLPVAVFKPLIDQRYDANDVVSHDAKTINAIPVTSAQTVLNASEHVKVVGIDEAQFFDMGIVSVAEQLALNGKRVIIAGLDLDYLAQPFGPMPILMAKSEYVTKLHAICMLCGNLASHSFRKTNSESLIVIGEKDLYEPRCRICYHKGMNA